MRNLTMRPKQHQGLLTTVCSAAVLMAVLANTSYAADGMSASDLLPQDCTVDRCVTNGGYAIEIISNDAPTNVVVGDTVKAKTSNDRADVYGNFTVRLANGGVVWATEDPAVLQPRLAVRGPSRLAIQGSRILEDAKFDVYLNYPAFVEKLELLVFDGNDTDLISPVYRASKTTSLSASKTYTVFDINMEELSKLSVFAEDELIYILRAFDSEGRMDETVQKRLQILDVNSYDSAQAERLLQVQAKPRKTPPMLGSQHIENRATADIKDLSLDAAIAKTPLNGNVLVLEPGQGSKMVAKQVPMPDEYKSYVVMPKFGTRKTNLRASDKAELDRIITQWKNAKDIQIEVEGHTDNVRIAPKNRKEFADNYVLSNARAQVVAEYIASALNIPMERVLKRGVGPDQPVASNSTAEGRQKNRRVEVKIAGNFPPKVATKTVMTAVPNAEPLASLIDPGKFR